MVASPETDASAPPAARMNRVERFLGRLGLAALGLAVIPVVIGIDLALTQEVGPLTRDSGEDAVDLVTVDGRELGWAAPGIRLVHTPHTLYENFPNQTLDGYRINSIGLRAPEITLVPERPRVIVIGGSAAFGLGVEGRDTLSSALGRELAEAEVLNAGVIGYQSSQELALVVYKLLDLKPSLILAFSGWNDLFETFWWERFGDAEMQYRGNVIFNEMETRLLKYREIEWNPGYAIREAGLSIVRNSTILSALYRGVGRSAGEQAQPVSPATAGQRVDQVAEHYVANMKKLSDLARSRGGRLLVVLQPEEGQLLSFGELSNRSRGKGGGWPGFWYWSNFPASYLAFRSQVALALAQAGIEVIDASRLLRDQAPTGSLFVDAVHMTPAGYALTAQLIRDEVRDALGPQELALP